ncbi:hypothetical protein J7K92_00730 [bacterium]|nr:hypothetical protein [bacterium]
MSAEELVRKMQIREEVLDTIRIINLRIAEQIIRSIEEDILLRCPEILEILNFTHGRIEIRKGEAHYLAKVTLFRPKDHDLLEITRRLRQFSETVHVWNVSVSEEDMDVLIDSLRVRDASEFKKTILQIFSDFLD